MDYMEIKLTQSRVAKVDAADYGWLSKWKWYHYRGYARRWRPAQGSVRKSDLRMHREILKHHGFNIDGLMIDHANRDKLDNRRGNLRPATKGQNERNRGLLSNNTSGYIGTSLASANRGWRAYIKYRGQEKHLGYFDDLTEAARTYDQAALQYHGDFATLNFPEEQVK